MQLLTVHLTCLNYCRRRWYLPFSSVGLGAISALGSAGGMQPVILAVGRARKGIIVALVASALVGDSTAARLARILTARYPFVNLVVGPMLSVDELLPLFDFVGFVLHLLSWLHVGGCLFTG